MLQFNRKVEYALAVVGYLATASNDSLHSARSVAEATHIPFDMVTKCLQRLHRQGFCDAVQGKHGGYRLSANMELLSVGDFLDQVFEPVAVAECLATPERSECGMLGQCDLTGPMQYLNDQIIGLLHRITLREFLHQGQPVVSSLSTDQQQTDSAISNSAISD